MESCWQVVSEFEQGQEGRRLEAGYVMSEMPETQFESNYPREESASNPASDTKLRIMALWKTAFGCAVFSLLCSGIAWLYLLFKVKGMAKNSTEPMGLRAHAAYLATICWISLVITISVIAFSILGNELVYSVAYVTAVLSQLILTLFVLSRARSLRKLVTPLGNGPIVRLSEKLYRTRAE